MFSQHYGYWWPGDLVRGISSYIGDYVPRHFQLFVGWFIDLWEIWLKFEIINFQTHIMDEYLEHFLWNCNKIPLMNSQH